MDKAIEIVRSYFSKMTGEGDFISSADVPPINWMGFDVIEAVEKEGVFVVRCEVKEELLSPKKRRYRVKVDAKGELREVKRENEGENIQV